MKLAWTASGVDWFNSLDQSVWLIQVAKYSGWGEGDLSDRRQTQNKGIKYLSYLKLAEF